MQHALLVVDDDLGSPKVEQALQAVVAVDHPAVQIVEIRRREAAAVELHHRPQVGRDARHGVENHRPRIVDAAPVLVPPVERTQDLETLDRLLLALGRQRPAPVGRLNGGTQLSLLDVEVHVGHELCDRLGAHAALEVLAVAILQLTPEILVVDDHPLVQVAKRCEGTLDEVLLFVGFFVDGLEVLVGLALGRTQLALLGVLGLQRGELLFELDESFCTALGELLVDDGELLGLLGLEPRQVGVQLLALHLGDEIRGEVDDAFERLGLELLAGIEAGQEVRQPRPGAAQVPDVHHRRGQLDVAHALAPHLGAGDLHPAALADDALEPDALVLAATAFPVLGGTEDLLAEQAVLFGLERAVVDGLRLADLAVGPGTDGVRGRQADPDVREVVDVDHELCPALCVCRGSSWGAVAAAGCHALFRCAGDAARLPRRCRAQGD